MRIAIIGAGNMGSWLVESMCLDYEVGVFDVDRSKLKYFFHCRKFLYYDELLDYQPEIVINAVSLEHTISVFREIVPSLPPDCIISDITSVKNGLAEYYKTCGKRFVSTHPMFGPTFANIRNLSNENAIIITESDEEGKEFFRKYYGSLHLRIHEYSFREHDETIAYSLTIPFSSTLVFASCMKVLDAPGTTFKKHLEIARGLLTEDDYLLSEILLNSYSIEQVEKIHTSLDNLIGMIKNKDKSGLKDYFDRLRDNIGMRRPEKKT
jgi:prephenate dehydrogenase